MLSRRPWCPQAGEGWRKQQKGGEHLSAVRARVAACEPGARPNVVRSSVRCQTVIRIRHRNREAAAEEGGRGRSRPM